MVTGPSCQVLTCHNTRNVVLMLLVLSMVCRIKPCSCRAMPRCALPMPYPIQSYHVVPCNVSLAVGVCYAPSQCNANQQMPLARETSTTEHSTLVVAPCHINQTHTCARHLCVLFLLGQRQASHIEHCEKHHNVNSSHQIDFASISRSTRTRPRETHDYMSQPSPSTLLRAPRRQRPPHRSSKDSVL